MSEIQLPKVGLATIVCKDEKVLLGRRIGAHGSNTWSFPGGHLEWNEAFIDCAKRETSEEAGIEITNVRFLHTTNDVMPSDGKHYITIFMLADHVSGTPTVCEPDKMVEWQWFRWEELPQPLFTPIENLIAEGFHPFVQREVKTVDHEESSDAQRVIEKTRRFVREEREHAEVGDDWDHVERVWKLARYLASRESDIDEHVIELAALLHEMADWKFYDGDQEAGARIAREWLVSLGVSEQIIRHVCEIIAHLSYRGAEVPDHHLSLEGKIVQDADRLDAMGAIGIARTFAYGGAKHRPFYSPDVPPTLHTTAEAYRNDNSHTINHFYEKLLLLKDRMHTNAAKKIAAERHVFMERYLEQFFKEWSAEPNVYQKLVRDSIPDIIREHGDTAAMHVASAEEYWKALVQKLREEVDEFSAEPSVEELADLLEVMYGICGLKGWGIDVLERVRREKTAHRGGFSKRIILEKTD